MRFSCIMFDLDGTLLNTLTTLAYYCNDALKTYGLAPYTEEAYKKMVGNGAKTLVHRMLTGRGADTDEMFAKVYQTYITRYHANPAYKTTVYPGIAALFAALLQNGIRIAALSNKPHEATVPLLHTFLGADSFDACVGAREGAPLKPDPAVALEIAEKLGVKPQACMYVGDTAVDMETGKRAGFYTIGVLWGFRDRAELEAAGADKIVASPLEILECLKM